MLAEEEEWEMKKKNKNIDLNVEEEKDCDLDEEMTLIVQNFKIFMQYERQQEGKIKKIKKHSVLYAFNVGRKGI